MSITDLNFSNQFHDYNVLPYPSPGNQHQFMANIRYLEQKITATTRSITYWDLYKIDAVLTDPNAFQSTINDLLPYTSLVINTKGTTGKEGGDYSPGDIFVKHNDGTYTKIKAERGGIFYPNQILREGKTGDKNYNYTISYQYSANAPSIESSQSDSHQNTDEENGIFECNYAKKMIYKNITGGLVGSPYNKVYNYPDISKELSLDGIKDTNNKYVAPIVKCFIEYNNQLEEVYCDMKIDYQEQETNTYNIQFLDDLIPTFITKVVIK